VSGASWINIIIIIIITVKVEDEFHFSLYLWVPELQEPIGNNANTTVY
jgi:hypothetical protein